jgi:murein DD-endopeptidase MepM/ murein hydrolase activator NlpD
VIRGDWQLLLLLGSLGLPSALASPGPLTDGLLAPEQVPSQSPVADLLPADRSSRLVSAALPPDGLATLGLRYPLDRPAVQIDPWGWRWSESRRAWRMHTGIDLAVNEGTAVVAAGSGQVRLVEVVGAYGLCVLIDHGQGLETLYAHLLDASVTPGQSVEAGEVIARVGASGSATGPHLHFELRRRGEQLTALDPTPYLPPLLPPPLPPSIASTTR